MRSLIQRFSRRRDGSVIVETAMALPLLVLLLLGGMETARLVMVTFKLEKAASTVADLVAREEVATPDAVNNVLSAVQHVMAPFALGDDGVVIVSSVTGTGEGVATVNWQVSGAGTLAAASEVGITGGGASLPGGLALREDVTAIVAEVAYEYTFLIAQDWSPLPQFRYSATFRPRKGGLDRLNSG